MKIKYRNFFLFISPAIMFVIIIFFFVYNAIEHIELESKRNINQSLTTVLNTTQEALKLWTDDELKQIRYATNNEKIKSLTSDLIRLSKTDHQAQHLKAKLNDITSALKNLIIHEFSFGYYQSFFIISPQRVTLSSMYHNDIGQENIINLKRKHYLDRVFSGESIFIPTITFESATKQKTTQIVTPLHAIFIAAPIYDQQGNVIAAIAFGINPKENVMRILNLGQIGESGETYAFDKSGLLITSSRFDNDLQTAGEISKEDTSVMSIKITDPGTNLLKSPQLATPKAKRPLTLMVSKAITGDFTKQLEPYRDYRGVPVFGVWVWDKTLDIGIATEIDVNEALLPHHRTKNTIFIIFSLILFLAVCLMILFIWMKDKENKILIEHQEELEDLVKKRTLALEHANDNLKKLSETDPLTLIANRRLYDITLKDSVISAMRSHQPISLLVIDIDFFKAFNDHYGHDMGDIAIKKVASMLKDSLPRQTDFLARFGGEEFAVILPKTEDKGAYLVAERLRKAIESIQLTHELSLIAKTLTVSIGIASLNIDDLSTDSQDLNMKNLFKNADLSLYQAKEQGRNRSVLVI
jgi:diguanylate cyclase (GGDEF)-like protein